MGDIKRIEQAMRERDNHIIAAMKNGVDVRGDLYREERAAVDELIAMVKRFEDAKVNWFTDCPSCCHLLDGNYELYVEREEARADVKKLRIGLDYHQALTRKMDATEKLLAETDREEYR